jgi:hypothetical protein
MWKQVAGNYFKVLFYVLQQGLNETMKISVMIAGLRPEILAGNLPVSSRRCDLYTEMLGGEYNFNPAKGH